MNTVICTLFEGNYHLGVAALSNSLYKQGYRGSIYAGYRGELPMWVLKRTKDSNLEWDGAKTISVGDRFQIHFLPLKTDYHLTNYKPDFMLELCDRLATEAESIFFFDSDIIVTSKWSSFDKWVECGVALCEDVNSPIAENHPRRVGWRNYFSVKEINLSFKNSIYVNGGFIGINKKDILFLKTWKILQEEMASEVGGLNNSSLNGNTLPLEARDEFDPFPKTDQDALNATIEAYDGKISFVGKEGMGFGSGSTLMQHPLLNKPWDRNFVKEFFFYGNPPRVSDLYFWRNVNGPKLRPFTNSYVKGKIILCKALRGLGRFYTSEN